MSLDAQDVLKLENWSFLKDYRKRQAELIQLAQAAYRGTKSLLGYEPTPDDCERLYTAMLIGTDIFRGIVARKRHLPPAFYESMSLALAKYVLHTQWSEISVS